MGTLVRSPRPDDCDSQSIEDTDTENAISQELLADAYRNGDCQAVEELLNADPVIEINCNDEQEMNQGCCVSSGSSDDLLYILG